MTTIDFRFRFYVVKPVERAITGTGGGRGICIWCFNSRFLSTEGCSIKELCPFVCALRSFARVVQSTEHDAIFEIFVIGRLIECYCIFSSGAKKILIAAFVSFLQK